MRRLQWAVPCGALWLLTSAAGWAQAEDKGQLLAERQALIERFANEERACSQRFAVTSCVDEVRSRRRAALAPLRERELRLEEAERNRRAAERRAAIAAKQGAAASRPAASPAPQVQVRPPPPPMGAASPPVARAPRAPGDEASRAAQAQQRAREMLRRQQEALDTQKRIQRRQAEREAAGHKPDPLPVPVPGAASTPAR